MKARTFIGYCLVPLAFMACTGDDEQLTANAGQPITLGSTVGNVTRSNNAENLLNGDTVYVWTDMVNAATLAETPYFDAWALKANGVGGLSTLAAGNNKLFPATNALNFYALVGNFGKKEVEEQQVPFIDAETTELPTTTGIQHTVLSDQTEPEAYYKSDLLYAVVKNQEPVSDAVVLPFQHLLSRIQVVLVAGNGMTQTELQTATVELLGMKRQVTFKPDKEKNVTISTDPDVAAASRANLTSMLTIPATAQQGNIRLKTSTVEKASDATGAGSSVVYADAIVVPQKVSAGRFIHVRYLDRDTYFSLDEDFTFVGGKQYRFRLIADRIGETYELNAITVETWGDATTPVGVWLD